MIIESLCYMTFALSSSAIPYKDEIYNSLYTITQNSGIEFKQDSISPQITFWIIPKNRMSSNGRIPIGIWDGKNIFVSNGKLRQSVLIHEIMHAVGVGHTSEGNVSYSLVTGQTDLGPQDINELNKIGCNK